MNDICREKIINNERYEKGMNIKLIKDVFAYLVFGIDPLNIQPLTRTSDAENQ